jgi:hypothetical protein
MTSLLQRYPHFRVVFALKTAVWDLMRCPYFTVCPHFTGLLFTDVTVAHNTNSLFTEIQCFQDQIFTVWGLLFFSASTCCDFPSILVARFWRTLSTPLSPVAVRDME